MIAQNRAAGCPVCRCRYGPCAISSKFVFHPFDDPTVTTEQVALHPVAMVRT
jgi:hypothetical protein